MHTLSNNLHIYFDVCGMIEMSLILEYIGPI